MSSDPIPRTKVSYLYPGSHWLINGLGTIENSRRVTEGRSKIGLLASFEIDHRKDANSWMINIGDHSDLVEIREENILKFYDHLI